MNNISTPAEQTYPDCILTPLLAGDPADYYLPSTACVVENTSSVRNEMLCDLAADAEARGVTVVLAQQSGHDEFSRPALPEQAAVRRFVTTVLNNPGQAQIILIVPRLEFPLPRFQRVLSQVTNFRGAHVVVGAQTLAGPFAPGLAPHDFPLLWHENRLHGQHPVSRAKQAA